MTTSTAGMSTGTGTYDVSSWFRSLTMEFTADDHDDTTFGLTAHSHVQGLYSWSAQGEAFQDYASTGIAAGMGIDSLFYDLLNNKIKFNIFVRPILAARSSDNPEYSGPVRSFAHRAIGGSIGDPLMLSVNFQGSGNFSRSVAAS
jgi:hypothetical protein